MMKIEKIWDELTNDHSIKTGLLLRRYSGTVLPDIYVALQNPEKLLAVCTSIDSSIDISIASFANLQEVKVDLFPSPNEPNKNLLVFKLLNFQHKDIFTILSEDLIASISEETNQKKLVQIILNRFEKWKSLFSKTLGQGLTAEEQRGLYGELYFLRQLLSQKDDSLACVNSWLGPESENRDFQNGNWALEVKTTHTNNHQKVHINNERQLDTNNLQNLFLYHISLEKRKKSGETLNEIVNSINSLLQSNIISQNRFKNKLFEIGYFSKHYHLYEDVGYFIRQDLFYLVESDFPRIEEGELRDGVGDVKYSIIISQCSNYVVDSEYVIDNIYV